MKLPWVNRADAERNVLAADLRAELWQRFATEQGKRLDDMTARYHALRLQGFSEPLPNVAPVPRPKPDVVEQAISSKAGNDRRLRALMQQQARADLATGKSPDEIALQILSGVSPEDAFAIL